MLQLIDIHFAFRDKIIFKGLNISFKPGEITGIMGKNGVGKTTLFRLLASIYKHQAGAILMNGQNLSPGEVALMPTDPFFYYYMTGEEYIKLVAKDPQSVLTMAETLDLPLNHLIDTYSTGMRKKLAFAAIINQPKSVIILDEPFNGVDLESNEIIKLIIRRSVNERIVLLSSHILSTLTDICDRIYYFQEGSHVHAYSRPQFDELSQQLQQELNDKLSEFWCL